VGQGRIALSGLGGVGKTQIAIEYAYRYRADYEAVLWANADERSLLTTSFAEIAKLLGLPEQHEQDQAKSENAVRRWLQEHDGWLLIYDNADDPLILRTFTAGIPGGHILLTSRAQNFDEVRIDQPFQPLEVSQMPPSEAVAFLFRRTGRTDADLAEKAAAQALAADLDYLLLALEQAAAFIAHYQSRFQDYLRDFRVQRLALLEQSKPVAGNANK
jgi:hypothetical protein